MSDLHVITVISNPLRYRSRYQLYWEFKKRILQDGARLYTVEHAYADQDFAVTRSDTAQDIQVRSSHLIWNRENLVNVALRRLPPDWRYVSWIDADIAFARPDWIEETLRQLKRHSFVQMFSHILNLGPRYAPLKVYDGFAYRQAAENAVGASSSVEARTSELRYNYGLTGGAWAARREALEAVGGLIDWSILGANDYYMALGMVAKIDPRLTRMPDSNYARSLLAWQDRCQARIGCDVGYLENLLLHYWHGDRKNRDFGARWQILVDHQFDPAIDLRTNDEGLLELTDVKPGLRDAIRAYFIARQEDAT